MTLRDLIKAMVEFGRLDDEVIAYAYNLNCEYVAFKVSDFNVDQYRQQLELEEAPSDNDQD